MTFLRLGFSVIIIMWVGSITRENDIYSSSSLEKEGSSKFVVQKLNGLIHSLLVSMLFLSPFVKERKPNNKV
jgi:hypothetical protein